MNSVNNQQVKEAMLVIKRSQFETLAKIRRDNYLTHFVRILKEDGVVDDSASETSLRAKILAYGAEAKQFNFSAEKNINTFVYASFALGGRFYETDEGLRSALENQTLTEDERAAILERAAEDRSAKSNI